MMEWQKLLSLKRDGDLSPRKRINENPLRIGFEVDFDRIIFSSPFRKLQDKTQVIPLPKNQFVHTRLTHSLETSSVGRSLGRMVGLSVINNNPELQKEGYQISDFGSIVASGCLAHDIGNPPFGHSGEEVIRSFYKSGKGRECRNQMSENQWYDLINFDGNANGFHILNRCQNGIHGGLRLTYAVLGAFLKYPKNSIPYKGNSVFTKKFSYNQIDKHQFLNVVNTLGLNEWKDGIYVRHPLAFLVEAADDICYMIIDFEDALNTGIIDESIALEYLIPIVKEKIISKKYYALKVDEDRFAYLRALTIGVLIEDMAKIFIDNEKNILEGKFQCSLKEKSKYYTYLEDIIKLSREKLYNHPTVLEKELSGFEILNSVMNITSDAMVFYNNVSDNYRQKIIKKLIPKSYLGQYFYSDSVYERNINMCSFVSNLTDREAVDFYNKIKYNI